MAAEDGWSARANDALSLSLVVPSGAEAGLETLASFRPRFTYPIFGEEEQIFGYKGLDIKLRYHASDMRPNLAISYRKKFPPLGGAEPNDIEALLKEGSLPDVAFQKLSMFNEAIRKTSPDWTPPGEKVTTLETGTDATYEIWKGTLADPAVCQLVSRIQILVPLFIEAGTPLDLGDTVDHKRWTVFFLYQNRPSVDGEPSRCPYTFAGYSTVYRFIHLWPPAAHNDAAAETAAAPQDGSDGNAQELSQLPTAEWSFDTANFSFRTRISQFLITPPFQRKGLGPKLYEAIYQEYAERHPATVEITVEDPNEAFDDMRDLADLKYLRAQPEFQALRIDTSIAIPDAASSTHAPANIVDPKALNAVRTKFKIAPRQFARVLELDLMSRLPEAVRPGIPDMGRDSDGAATLSTAAAVAAAASKIGAENTSTNGGGGIMQKGTPEQIYERRLWRLMVKQRVYRSNKDALGEFEIGERIVKLDETLAGLEFDYARLLAKAERQEQAEQEERGQQSADEGVKVKDVAVNGAKRKLDKFDEADAGNGGGAGDDDQGPPDTARKRARTEEMPDA